MINQKNTLCTIMYAALCLISGTTGAMQNHRPAVQKSTNPYETHWFHKRFAALCSSDWMSERKAQYAQEFTPIQYPFEDNPATIALGDQAYDALGVTAKFRLPIYKEWEIRPISHSGAADARGILIPPNFYSCSPYWQRYTMFHEAAHVRYNDAYWKTIGSELLEVSQCGIMFAAGIFAARAAIIGSKLENKITNTKFVPLAILGAMTGGFIGIGNLILWDKVTGPFVKKYFSKYCERRADTCALHASACSNCITKTASIQKDYSPEWEIDAASEGYLTAKQIEAIANQHHRANRQCTHRGLTLAIKELD